MEIRTGAFFVRAKFILGWFFYRTSGHMSIELLKGTVE